MNPKTADLMVHNIKHDYDQQEDQMAAIIRGHMYPTRKTLRRREIRVFEFCRLDLLIKVKNPTLDHER